MINTYSESTLHRTLKNMYAERHNGRTEQEILGKICDVVTEGNEIIEIQTGGLGKLREKLERLCPSHKVRIVLPLATVKRIETVSPDGSVLSRRKSPKRQTLFSVFRELTSLYPFLAQGKITLEVLESEITEVRVRTDRPVQLANKSRRFLRPWYKQDKRLDKICGRHVFSSARDLMSLLPDTLPEVFCAQDLASCGAGKEAGAAAWVLARCGTLEEAEATGRKKYFKRAEPRQASKE